MDERYKLQVMIDMGRDIEAKVSCIFFDCLTDAMAVYSLLTLCRDVISVRIVWGGSIIIEDRREYGQG